MSEQKKEHRIELGTPVEDIITGFKGIAIARLEHLTGCTQYGVAPRANKEGKFEETLYIDETRLKETGKKIQLIKKEASSEEPPGGPCQRIRSAR